MDIIFEIIFDLIIDGSHDAVSDKKAPIGLRVAAAIVLLALYGALIGFCIYLTVHESSWIAAAVAVVILVITIPEMIKAFRKNREKHS